MEKLNIFNKIIFIRHGQSFANLENKFTGWLDVDLTKKGYNEAYKVGLKLKKLNYKFDICYTSLLKRAIRTTWAILDGLNELYIPIKTSLYLNERHYGNLSGLNKFEGIKKFGEENIWKWLNTYEESPPPLDFNNKKLGIDESKYKNISKNKIPLTESLNDALKRVIKLWKKKIIPNIKLKKKLLIVAHSNILKILINYIDKTKNKKIELIPNSTPIVYEFNKNLKITKNYFI